MAIDFNKPTTADLRTDYATHIRDNLGALAKMDPSLGVNFPTDAMRYVSGSKRFEKWDGGAWAIELEPAQKTQNETISGAWNFTGQASFVDRMVGKVDLQSVFKFVSDVNTAAIGIGGGSDTSTTVGARMLLYGNSSGAPGQFLVETGAVSGSHLTLNARFTDSQIRLHTANLLRRTLDENGHTIPGGNGLYHFGSSSNHFSTVQTWNVLSTGIRLRVRTNSAHDLELGVNSGVQWKVAANDGAFTPVGAEWNIGTTTSFVGTGHIKTLVQSSTTVPITAGIYPVLATASGTRCWASRGDSTQSLTHMAFYDTTTLRGTITVSSSGASFTSISDYRLKENVLPITAAKDLCRRLKPKEFNFIGSEERVYGFLAHEQQEVAPYSVTGEKDGEEYQQADYAKLIPILTATINELIDDIEKIKRKIKDDHDSN